MTGMAKDNSEPQGKILVVDDDPRNVELLEAYLRGLANYGVITAQNGIEALERAADARQMATFLQVAPFRDLGRPIEIVGAFGGREDYVAAVKQLQQQIYAVA